MCPFPQLRLVGVKTSYVFFFLIFPGHLEFWTPLQIPIWGPPLGCTLFQYHATHALKHALATSFLRFRQNLLQGSDTSHVLLTYIQVSIFPLSLGIFILIYC